MKSKLIIHKSRSPARYNLEQSDSEKQSLKAFAVDKVKLPKNELMELFIKRARSNSPRKGNKNIQNLKEVVKYRSPRARKNSPLDFSRNKVAPTSQRGLRSPRRIQNNISPKRFFRNDSPPRMQPFESEEIKTLKLLAKRRHRLNKELWEAAENGDTTKISQLLEPYSLPLHN